LERISSEFSSFANFPDPQFQTNNLVAIVQNAIDLYSFQAKISFQHPEVLMISIDSEMIMRAVGNLIKNAIQAYGEQEKFGKIGISLKENENDIVLTIEDWAGGIPEEIQSKIFQPNFTTKSSGMGLGLSLIQRTIESHQGNIQLEVKPHVGCIFEIRFPKDHGQ
jgi:nitrogen fixation/metabolism regulation signal transduction histidine kinase